MLLDIAGRIKRIVTVEENAVSGGFGSAVAALLENSKSDARVECIGIPDEFVVHGPQKVLRAKYNLDADGVAQRVVSAFPELAARSPAKPNR
jgi:1-deoxy-D-xylulose-5-phosphate synthase